MPDGSSHARFTVVPYDPAHLRRIALRPSQGYLAAFIFGTDQPERIAAAGPSWSALVGDEPIACAGFRECWAGRHEAWAIVSDAAAPYTVRLVREIRRGIAGLDTSRIEATTDIDDPRAGHFALAAGFRPDGVAACYLRGADHQRWVILKPSGNPHTPV